MSIFLSFSLTSIFVLLLADFSHLNHEQALMPRLIVLTADPKIFSWRLCDIEINPHFIWTSPSNAIWLEKVAGYTNWFSIDFSYTLCVCVCASLFMSRAPPLILLFYFMQNEMKKNRNKNKLIHTQQLNLRKFY